MSTRAERWRALRERAEAAAPRVTVDGGRVRKRWLRRGWAVTVRGANLRLAIVPPDVTVGGQRVRDLRARRDGRLLRGVIDARPHGDHIVVDYGFMRGDGRLG